MERVLSLKANNSMIRELEASLTIHQTNSLLLLLAIGSMKGEGILLQSNLKTHFDITFSHF